MKLYRARHIQDKRPFIIVVDGDIAVGFIDKRFPVSNKELLKYFQEELQGDWEGYVTSPITDFTDLEEIT